MIKLAFTYMGKVEIEVSGESAELMPQVRAAMAAADQIINPPVPAHEAVEPEPLKPTTATTH